MRWVIRLGLLFASVLALFGITELAYRHLIRIGRIKVSPYLYSDEMIKATEDLYDTDADENLGYRLKKNNFHHAAKTLKTGRLVYDVVYTTDKYRRRVTQKVLGETTGEDSPGSKEHLIVFGGSSAYGEGLNDSETLQYFLSQKLTDYSVLNYAVHGYGPNHMLALFESGDLTNEIRERKGIALYFFIDNHIERVLGSTRIPWAFYHPSWSSPYYYLDDQGVLVRDRSFATSRPFISELYKKYLSLKSKSSLLSVLDIHFPVRTTEKHLKLATEIFLKSKRLYQEQFDGELYVVFHPCSKKTDRSKKIKDMFKKKGIQTLDYTDFDCSPEFLLEEDLHPNAKLNEILADKIIKDLQVK